jgi:hypothetical protein
MAFDRVVLGRQRLVSKVQVYSKGRDLLHFVDQRGSTCAATRLIAPWHAERKSRSLGRILGRR